MENGLVDADLGGFLYKKRIARPGGGKSGGYRTLLSARIDSRYVFLHGLQGRQGKHHAGREEGAADIKRLREGLKFSQPVFALHLHTSASTVRKWEQGDTHPTGPALKLLNILADKGLQAII